MLVEYRNGTGLLAVIGDPVAHSLSPLLQNTMIRELGRDDLYLAIPVKRGGLPAFIQAAETIGITGFNLTMPHKTDILPFLADMTHEARRAGSVNSVRIRGNRLEGHSTDGIGFRRALQDMGMDYPDQIVTILGAGGAARSIAMTAADSGARQVRIVNRTPEKAEELCAGEAMDCIYAPAMTPFMSEAKALGHPTANGIGMLVYQAIYAYAFFRDLDFEPETVSQLGALLLEASGVDPSGAGKS